MAGPDNKDTSKPPQAERSSVTVVGIGASAGGIQALQGLFKALPDTTGAAFVVILHLDPEHQSSLAQILAACTAMPVIQVEKAEKLNPNHVYVIPPNRRLQLIDGEVTTAEFDEPRGHRVPIDLFFRSLAERGDGFAVVLSGSGADGAVGVRAVKGNGGIVLAQDPSEAEYSSMPSAAIATGIVDFVLPVRQIAEHLVDLIRGRGSVSVAASSEVDEDLLRQVLAHLRARTGHDFSKYKRSTVLRRLARRMQVTRTEGLQEYYKFLRSNSGEAQALLGDLLITVTSFFRDPHVFEALKTRVLPELFAGRDVSETIRIWVSGCATGEEAYTIAMLLLEEAGRHELKPPIQIFASDLDAQALMTAREGHYPAAIEADVSEERLRRFFTAEKDAYRARQDVRDLILFANHDLLKDPPFSRVDLISCRNLLIYLDRDLQEQVANTFYYALNPGGYLMLGTAEAADVPVGLFRPIDRNARIYQSTARPGEKPRPLPRLLGGVGTGGSARRIEPIPARSDALTDAAAHRQALEQLAPPSVMVDELHNVIHLSETAGRYMQPSGGQLTSDLGEIVRPELRFELRSALHRAFEQGEPTLTLPIPVQFNGTPQRVNMLVKPVKAGGDVQPRTALVMFIEGGPVDDSKQTEGEQASDETVRRLTDELDTTRARLRSVREESESGNEELRAANEELQSINEEYRSTSEELETSKEELQSMNEELQTVNNELKVKLDVASRANSDLENLIAATNIATLFLDTSLRIKRFTEQLTALFSVTPADAGRPITDFSHQLEYGDLVKDARAVLADLTPINREVRSRDGHWYDVRMRPYRTLDNKIDGVVITFFDLTERKLIERKLEQRQRLVDLSSDAIFAWDLDGTLIEWNRGTTELYGYNAAEAIGKNVQQLLRTKVPGSSFEAIKAALERDGQWQGELQQTTKDGRSMIVESRMQLDSTEDQRLVLEVTREKDRA